MVFPVVFLPLLAPLVMVLCAAVLRLTAFPLMALQADSKFCFEMVELLLTQVGSGVLCVDPGHSQGMVIHLELATGVLHFGELL